MFYNNNMGKESGKRVTFVYGFHNDTQIDYFFLSSSILFSKKENQKHSILLMISQDIEDKFGSKIDKHLRKIECETAKKVVVDFFVGTKWCLGKFYYLFAPYVCESDIFIQVDNDILITYDINDCLEELIWNDNDIFYGVNDKILTREGMFRQTVKDYINDNESFEKYLDNYINTGFVIFNNSIKNLYSKNELSELIWNTINNLRNLTIENNYKKFQAFDSDQNVLFINFRDKMNSSINSKYNVILGSNWLLTPEIEGYHLNWWLNGHKFDFIDLFRNKSFNKMLCNMYSQLNDFDFKLSETTTKRICKRLYIDIYKKYRKVIKKAI